MPSGLTAVPEKRPTLEEFRDFSGYVESIREEGMQHGIIKVIPPKGWAHFPAEEQEAVLDGMKLTPISQCIGRAGRGAFRLGIVEGKRTSARSFMAASAADPPPLDPTAATFEELDRAFWRGMSTYAPPPQYGADVVGSLMCGEAASGWNLDALDTVLGQCTGQALGGITRSMLYLGAWRSMFAWHCEDMDLYSINYLHRGAPKAWYAVPCASAGRFEAAASGFFGEEALGCREYLRHKTSMLSPRALKEAAVPVHWALQRPGEFVITFPRGYHAGFNAGSNVAEAVNFALPSWLPMGQVAATRRCKCNADAVHIDMRYFAWRLKLLQSGVAPADLPTDAQCAAAATAAMVAATAARDTTLRSHIHGRLGGGGGAQARVVQGSWGRGGGLPALPKLSADDLRARMGLPPLVRGGRGVKRPREEGGGEADPGRGGGLPPPACAAAAATGQ